MLYGLILLVALIVKVIFYEIGNRGFDILYLPSSIWGNWEKLGQSVSQDVVKRCRMYLHSKHIIRPCNKVIQIKQLPWATTAGRSGNVDLPSLGRKQCLPSPSSRCCGNATLNLRSWFQLSFISCLLFYLPLGV